MESAATRTWRSGQAQAVGLIALGVDRVVAHEALTYWPRLEGLAP